jgi:hypothetical protein
MCVCVCVCVCVIISCAIQQAVSFSYMVSARFSSLFPPTPQPSATSCTAAGHLLRRRCPREAPEGGLRWLSLHGPSASLPSATTTPTRPWASPCALPPPGKSPCAPSPVVIYTCALSSALVSPQPRSAAAAQQERGREPPPSREQACSSAELPPPIPAGAPPPETTSTPSPLDMATWPPLPSSPKRSPDPPLSHLYALPTGQKAAPFLSVVVAVVGPTAAPPPPTFSNRRRQTPLPSPA